MIHKVAYLRVCSNCEQHAAIVLPDGSETEEFGSREQGHAVIARLLALKKIQADEAQFLQDEVQKTRLVGIWIPPEVSDRMQDGLSDDEELEHHTLH